MAKKMEIPANHTAPPAGLVSNYRALDDSQIAVGEGNMVVVVVG